MTARRLFGPEVLGPDAVSHCSLPTPLVIDDLIRVFVGARDRSGRTRIHAVDVTISAPHDVAAASGPLLPLGGRGHFDEDGTTPCSIVTLPDGRVRLYYIGWNRASGSVSYRLSIGSAISDDRLHFRRESDGPVLDRSRQDPILVTAPFVTLDEGRFEMHYVSGTRWELVDDHPEPCYELARATSADGLSWDLCARPSIGLATEALGRPSVVPTSTGRVLACSHRGSVGYRNGGADAYKLAFLREVDDRWTPIVEDLRPDGDSEWCSRMRCYSAVLPTGDQTLMLYNGDGFGASGVIAAPIDLGQLVRT